jgi:hypothetical protein
VPEGFLASPMPISREYEGVVVFIPTRPNRWLLYIRWITRASLKTMLENRAETIILEILLTNASDA